MKDIPNTILKSIVEAVAKMARNTKLLMNRVSCSACDRDDIPVYPLPYTDSFGDQVNLCEVCIKTGYEIYQKYLKWHTCRILGSSGSVKGIENLKNYRKLKAEAMAPNGGQKKLDEGI